MIGVEDDLGVGSGLPLPAQCVTLRWAKSEIIPLIWTRCKLGEKPSDYVVNMFMFQHTTRAFLFPVRLPDDGDSLADASEIEYWIYDPITENPIIQKTLSGSDITILTATSFTFTLDDSEMGIDAGKYRHECRLTTNSDEPSILFFGQFTVIDTVIGDA